MSVTLKRLTVDFLAARHDLMAFILGLVRDPHAAEDIFQDVWLRLADAVEQGVEVEALGKWCRAVARNLILHYWRSLRTGKVVADSRVLELVELAFEKEDPSRKHWASRRELLLSCLETLPPPSRELLRVVYEDGLPLKEAARRLGKSYEAAMKALSRVRQIVEECVSTKFRMSESRP